MAHYDDGQVTFLLGDVRDVLREMPAESVNMCVTSPPYWGLRDYGTATWEGGDDACEHTQVRSSAKSTLGIGKGQASWEAAQRREQAVVVPYRDTCGKCGATRIDQQLGLERTPEEYVAKMVDVFREVRRVLRPDGVLFLNIGDSYAGGGGFAPDAPSNKARAEGGAGVYDGLNWNPRVAKRQGKGKPDGLRHGLKPKDLVGIPWMLAFALRADGWYLRQDIIWAKPNPMPESVRDRCTKAHEYLFLLSKSERYYYDADAIREPAAWERWGDQTVVKEQQGTAKWIGNETRDALRLKRSGNKERKSATERGAPHDGVDGSVPWEGDSRNKRSVWNIATAPYAEAHFATFPPALVEPCILAGCHEGGTVLDPFIGSGTTALVARRLGRKAIGIDLNAEYLDMAVRRAGGQLAMEMTR